MKRLLLAIMTLALGANMFAGEFVIKKGVNVSHWLSQSQKRGKERSKYVTKDDFKQIKALGFDHVRLPIDEMQLWTEDGKQEKKAFKLMEKAIKWSLENDLKVIVDLHVLRSHHFNDANSRTLWTKKEAQEDFIGFWKQLSAKLNKYPTNMVAYEMMNEAVADDPEDWNKLMNWAISEIRKLEPNRTIIMGSNLWQQVHTFPDLRVPENDKNIILSFHTYTPMPLTHWKAPWTNFGKFDAPVNYPGEIIDPNTDFSKYDEETTKAIKNYMGIYDKKTMAKDIMIAVNRAKELGLPLYCGEFGCFPTTDMKMRQAWYKDMMEIFDENNIAWCHWNWKNDFPLVDEKTLEPIEELMDILIPRK